LLECALAMTVARAEQTSDAGNDGRAPVPISVFLVDDTPELREMIRYGMEQDPSFKIVGEAGDGRGAIDGIAQTAPAAVLLDLSMPDMDGFQAIPEIRSRQPGIAIIVVSGFSAERMRGRALERGADRYVEKGASIHELREVTRGAVADRRAA
jgi:DNA-binding NarL/FixJ family response regulator